MRISIIIVSAIAVLFFGSLAYADHLNLINGMNLDGYDNVIILNENTDSLFIVSNNTSVSKAFRIANASGAVTTFWSPNGLLYTDSIWLNNEIILRDQVTNKDHWLKLENHTLYLVHPNGEKNILNPVRCGPNETC